jgi:hypothetical protein
VRTQNRQINPSGSTNPFNYNRDYLKLYFSVKEGTSDKDEFGQLINPRYLDDVFDFKSSFTPLARKVKIVLPVTEWFHFREVQVFDYNGVNRASGKATRSSPTQTNDHASNAVDGNLGNGNFFHTSAKVSSKYSISACKFSTPYVSF